MFIFALLCGYLALTPFIAAGSVLWERYQDNEHRKKQAQEEEERYQEYLSRYPEWVRYINNYDINSEIKKSQPEMLPPGDRRNTNKGDIKHPWDWGYRRDYILRRDGFSCRQCGTDHLPLQVHHKIQRRHTADHCDTNLVALCLYCHAKQPKHGIGIVKAFLGTTYPKKQMTKRACKCWNCHSKVSKGEYRYGRGREDPTSCELCALKSAYQRWVNSYTPPCKPTPKMFFHKHEINLLKSP